VSDIAAPPPPDTPPLSSPLLPSSPPPPSTAGPLHGTGRLADEFFLTAHDDVSGKPRLADRLLGLGLAGALLGELAMQDRIDLRAGAVSVVERTGTASAPSEALGARMFEYLRAEEHPVRTWLAFFAQTARDDVAARLVDAGLVARHGRKRPWQAGGWTPTSANAAVLPAAQLVTRLVRGRPLSEQQTVLAGLLRATGLDQAVLWEARHSAPDAVRHLGEAVAALKPPLAELIGQTQAAVGAAVASHRT